MKYIDLTQKIFANMPVYPGTRPPKFVPACSLEKHGFKEMEFSMFTHTGTHIDSPAHLFESGFSLDKFSVDHFMGKAFAIDCTRMQPGSKLSPDLLKPIAKKLDEIDFVLFYTGWDKKWGDPSYFNGFPVLSPKLALELAGLNLKGVGIDSISVESATEEELVIHKILLAKNMIIIENLTNLGLIAGQICNFSCLPLKFVDADGSPVRAVATLE